MIRWLCVEFLHARDVHAIGGYLVNRELKIVQVLVDFTAAIPSADASIMALRESVHFAVEALGRVESELEIRSFCKELIEWLDEDKNLNWACRFLVNKLKNIKSWFKNIVVSF